ncbi:SCO family protein [Sinimarinibacterium sp. CAU 1509]|uniref:SCO family protein n=1 Tax=Sinimarinibacterium sp. CAU 1509 TaxID=2562283 RepID=UPI00200AB3E6|nr:SCO family protein [Sinimarinibacterium sp. CAU 1509]
MSSSNSSSPPNNRQALIVFAGVAALILGLIAAALLSSPKNIAIGSGTLLKAPRSLPEFSLIDQDGQPFTRESLLGHWTLIFPGFTYCPDICPTTLGVLKAVEAQLGSESSNLTVALFSIDPERDTPETLKRYVQYFSPNFIGVTTQEPQLKQMAQTLGVAYLKVPGDTPESYTMDHSAALVLIDPQARIAGYFTPPHQVDALVRDLGTVLRNRS